MAGLLFSGLRYPVMLKEKSWLAGLAARKMRSKRVALVLGHTIYLHRVSKPEFLADKAWLKHELCHVSQFERYGFFSFLVLYVWESICKGYHNNRFEVEARDAEGCANTL